MRLKLVGFLWNLAIILVTVLLIHILENVYTYSQYNYDSFFSVYSDNIGSRSTFEELSPILPVDVVYTWVNGSDENLLMELKKAKQKLVDQGVIDPEKHLSGEGQIYSVSRDPATNVSKIKCILRDCIETNFLVFESRSGRDSMSKEMVLSAFPEAAAAVRFVTPNDADDDGEVVFTAQTEQRDTFIIAEIPQQSVRERILSSKKELQGEQHEIIAYQAYLTTATMIEESLPWRESIMLSNLQPNLNEELQITQTLPSGARKGLVKVDIHKVDKIALVQFLEEQLVVDSLNYYYQNPAVLGQVQVNPCYLLWNLESIEPDPEWLSPSRFADNEELRYSLRSVEKFAPWIRHVFIVTNGQVPAWLNLESPRLTIVTHDQIFPPGDDYLPTFSSPAIESQLHKIPGLSKHFLYFNDDVMLGKKVYPQDFYTHQAGYKIYPGWPVPPCKDECPNAWVHDGYCDSACNNEECDFDGGDCLAQNGNVGGVREGAGTVDEGSDVSVRGEGQCAVGCADNWLSDKYCDASCNKKSCGYDMGDCGVNSLKQLPSYPVTSRISNQFSHPFEMKSFLVNVSNFSLKSGMNVSKVRYTKNFLVRSVKLFSKSRLVQVVLKLDSAISSDSEFNWIMKLHFAKGEIEDNILDVGFNFVMQSANKSVSSAQYAKMTAVVDVSRLGQRKPAVLTSVPYSAEFSPSTFHNLSQSALQALSQSKTLPRNVSRVLLKLSGLRANGSMSEQVFGQMASELLIPHRQQVNSFLSSFSHSQAVNEGDLHAVGLGRIGMVNANSRESEKEGEKDGNDRFNSRKLQSIDSKQGKSSESESNISMQSNRTSVNGNKKKTEMTRDTFRESLRFVNKLFDQEFGSSTQRMVIAHMPHFINRDIMEELQQRFPSQFEQTARHKVRMGNDMQYAFSYFHFIQSVKQNSNYLDVFNFFDSDTSGVLSDRELRVLSTYLYPTPISLETMNEFENSLRSCANARAQSGIVEDPPRNPETYFSQNMPQVTAMLLFNCREMLDKITSRFNADAKYKHEVVADVNSEVTFKMLPNNLSSLITMLDEVRHDRRKFICLNDNFDHQQQDAPLVRAVIQDFYEGLYPIQSQFELPREYRNRFLHVDELRAWQSFRGKLKLWSHVLLGILVVISIGSYIQEKVSEMYRKVGHKGQTLPR